MKKILFASIICLFFISNMWAGGTPDDILVDEASGYGGFKVQLVIGSTDDGNPVHNDLNCVVHINSAGNKVVYTRNNQLIFQIIKREDGGMPDWGVEVFFDYYEYGQLKTKQLVYTNILDNNTNWAKVDHTDNFIVAQDGVIRVDVTRWDSPLAIPFKYEAFRTEFIIDQQPPEVDVIFDPPGWTNGNIEMDIQAHDSQVGGEYFHFSFEGSDTVYDQKHIPYTLDNNTSFHIGAHDGLLNVISRVSFTPKIDRDNPIVDLNVSTIAYTNSSIKVIAIANDALSGIDENSYQFKVGIDGVWGNESSDNNVTIYANGTVYCRVSDIAGNSVESSIVVNNIDTTDPSLSIVLKDAKNQPYSSNTNNSDNISASVIVSDDFSGLDTNATRYTLTGAQSGSGSGTSASITTEGTTYVTFFAADKAGNENNDTAIIKIDRTAPVLTASRHPDSWTAGGVTVKVNVTDSFSGVDTSTIQYQIGSGGAWTSYTSNGVLVNANGIVNFKAKDMVGNEGTTSISVTNIDKTPPTATAVLSPAAGTWTKGSVRVTVTASDSEAGLAAAPYSFKVGSGAASAYSSVNYIDVSANGVVEYYVKDSLGNIYSGRMNVRNIDTTPPTVNLSLSTGSWTDGSVVVTATASDGGSGVNGSTYSFVTSSSVMQGPGNSNTLTVSENSVVTCTVIDNAGNQGTATIAVNKIDKGVPALSILGGPGSWWIRSESPVISLSASDSGSGVAAIKYKNSSGEWKDLKKVTTPAGTLTADFSSYTAGSRAYEFKAVDGVGRESAVVSRTVLFDNGAPSISYPKTGEWSNSGIIVFTASDAIAGVDGTSWSVTGVGGVIANKIGNNMYYFVTGEGADLSANVTVRDIAGNSVTGTFPLKVDKTAPSVSIAYENVDDSNGDPAGVKVTASQKSGTTDLSGLDSSTWRYYYVLDTGRTYTLAGASKSWNWSTGETCTISSGGTYAVYFKVSDIAGNEKTVMEHVEVDLSGPAFSAVSKPSGWVADQGNVSIFVSDPNGLKEGSWSASAEYSGDKSKSLLVTAVDKNDGKELTVTVKGDNDTNGVYTIYFKAKDSIGNSNTSAGIPVYIDTTGPSIIPPEVFTGDKGTLGLNGSVIDWVSSSSVTASFSTTDKQGSSTGSGVVSRKYSINGAAAVPFSEGSLISIIPEGINTLTIYLEDAVGKKYETTYTVKIDRSRPSVTGGGIGEYYVYDTLAISSWPGVTDTYTSSFAVPGELEYIFDSNTNWQSVPGTDVSTAHLAEGTHSISFRIDDLAGNYGIVNTPLTFEVDRTDPVIESIVITCNDKILGETDFAEQQNIIVDLTGSDNSGSTLYYSYVKSSVPLDNPVFPQTFVQSPVSIAGLANGVNYLYFQAKDEAGNVQDDFFSRVLRVDSLYPGAVEIKSQTHPEARDHRDAVSESDAVFQFQPASSGPAGIKGYEWQLYSGTTAETAQAVLINGAPLAGFETDAELALFNLPDNTESVPFYYVMVKAVSGNNKVRDTWSIYPFRIDTVPPKDLVVSSKTHSNSLVYYPSAGAVFAWNRPVDFSGVKTFYYNVSSTPIDLGLITEPGDVNTTWNTTSDFSLFIDLEKEFSAQVGTYYFAVVAEDFAGNIKSDSVSVNFDLEKPEVIMGDLSTLTSDRKASIAWSGLSDNLPGVKLGIQFYRIEEDGSYTPLANWRYFTEASGIYDFEGLDPSPEINYAIYFNAIDKAGNKKVEAKGFNFGSGEIELAIPFSELYHGFKVEGVIKANSGTGRVFFSESLDLSVNGGKISKLDFPSIVVDNGEFASASAPDLVYQLNLKGYTFTGTGLSFSKDTGLVLDNLVLSRDIGGDSNKTFAYENVGILGPPLLLFDYAGLTETGSFGSPSSFSYQSIIKNEDSERNGWLFKNISKTALKGEFWYFEEGRIDVAAGGLTDVYIFDDAGNKVTELPFTYLSVLPDGQILEGRIDGTFHIERNGIDYEVTNGLIRDDQIVVIEAKVAFAPDFIGEPLVLENFSLTIDNELVANEDFRYTDISFTKDGYVYTARELGFLSNYLVISDGRLTVDANNVIAFSDLILTKEDIDFAAAKSVDFSHTYFGYPVTGSDVSLGNGVFKINDAAIEIPSVFSGSIEQIRLTGLTVSIVDNSIVAAGEGDTSFTLSSVTDSYGSGARVDRIRLSAQGLYAQDMTVTVPDFMGSQEWIFHNSLLNFDGVVGVSESILVSPMTIGAFTDLSGTGITFDGKGISIGTVSAALTNSYSDPVLFLDGLTFNGNGIITKGRGEQTIYFNEDGWNFTLSDFVMDDTGLTAQSIVTLPAAYGSREVEFPHFKIFADRGYNSGSADEAFFIRLGGWKVRVSGISINNSELGADMGSIRLYSSMGGQVVTVPDIVLSSTGSIVSSGEGADPISFMAENGFTIISSSYVLKDDGIYLAGALNLPDALGSQEISFTDHVLQLNNDGSVTAPRMEGPYTYQIGGWDITARGLTVDREGLHIEENSVDLWGSGTVLTFGQIDFYADGDISFGGSTFKPFAFNVLDSGISVGMSRLWLSEKGISSSAFIGFPPEFATEYVYFDEITLHKEGYITSDVSVPELHFKKMGFDFLFRNIRLSEEGFRIGEAVITLPEAAESKKIRIHDFIIDHNGQFRLGGVGVDPFNLWGYTVYLDRISFDGDTVGFNGGVRLPEDFVISEIAGKRIDISKFELSLDGELKAFEVSSTESFDFKLFGLWDVTVNEFAVSPDSVKITKAYLHLPSEFNAGDIYLSGLVIADGKISLQEAGVNNIPLTYEGIDFMISNLAITETNGVIIKGYADIPETYPDGISGRLTVNKFQIKPDFTVGDIDAVKENINAPLFGGNFLIKNGSFGLDNTGGDGLLLKVAGGIELGPQFPPGVAGKTIAIRDFEVNTNTGELTKLYVSGNNFKFNLFDITSFEQDETQYMVLEKDQTTGEILLSLQGDIVLGSTFPDNLSGRRVKISEFQIADSGDIRKFKANLGLDPVEKLFDGIILKNGFLGASLNDTKDAVVFDVSGRVRLDDSFPTNIAGTEADIKEFRMDTTGEILALDVSIGLTDNLVLFDTLRIKNGVVALNKFNTGDILTSISGTVLLPANMPTGLANLPITIENFAILSDGTIQEVKFASRTEPLEIKLFDSWDLTITGFSLDRNKVSITNGTLKLPSEFNADEIYVKGFSVSLATGDVDLSEIGVNNISLDFEGLKFVVDNLKFTESEGLIFKGSVDIPSTFPNGISGTIFVDEFQIKPDFTVGRVTASKTGINTDLLGGQFSLQGGGFSLKNRAEGLFLGVTGDIAFGTQFPNGVAGKVISITEFEINTSTGDISALNASGSNFKFDLFGITRFEQGLTDSFVLTKDAVTGKLVVKVEGDIILSDGFPSVLSGRKVRLSTFEIDSSGSINEFSASLAMDPEEYLFDGVSVKSGKVSASLNSAKDAVVFDVGGTICLGDTFPKNIAGTEAAITAFKMDTKGDLLDLNINVSLTDNLVLFDTLRIKNGKVDISKYGTKDILTSVSGTVLLPASMPKGLADLPVDIEDFSILSTGEIQNVSFAAKSEDISVELFDSWNVTVKELAIDRSTVSVGSAYLHLPPSFKAKDIYMNGFSVALGTGAVSISEFGVNDIDVSFAGLDFMVNNLRFSETDGAIFKGYVDIPDTFPQGIAGRLTVDEFQIKPDFTVGRVTAYRDGINASILDGKLHIENGKFALNNRADGLSMGVTGDLKLGDQFPKGVAGKVISVHDFEINTSTGEMTKLHASAGNFSFDLLGAARVEQGAEDKIVLQKDAATGEITLSVAGDIVLADTMPDALKGQRVRIEKFVISDRGVIKEFSAGLKIDGEKQLFQGISIIDAQVLASVSAGASDVEFSVTGSVKLGSNFPKGLAGTVASITTFKVNTAGQILALDIQVGLPQLTLFDQLTLNSGRISFTKHGTGDVLINLGGSVVLPNSLPQGFAGLSIDINSFAFTSSGVIQTVDIGTSNINLNLFGGMSLEGGSIAVSNRGKDLLVFNIAGGIRLPASMPAGLGGKKFSILKLQFTSKGELEDFQASMEAGIAIDLFAGITFTFNTFEIGMDGIGLSGNLKLPDVMPEGLPRTVVLQTLRMNWSGEVTEIAAGISDATMKLGGFTTTVKNFIFHKDHVSIESCIVTLPPNMGGQNVGVVNAGFDYSGKFYGDVVLPEIRTEFAGFELVLYQPTILPEKKAIAFSKAAIRTPAMLGSAEIEVFGVSLGAHGLSLSGVTLSIPDFTIAGGLGFKGVGATFVSNGTTFLVEGRGSVFIPGLGSLSAEVSFSDDKELYPIGLKRAFFQYTVFGIGIPLGPSGLYLNAIRGGLAFGPPDELPSEVRPMFGNGTRIQLGLSMVDGSGGGKFRGDMDVWVDINNWSWVFKGDVSIGNGEINANIIAAMTSKVFYGKLYVEIKIARGQLEIWVFDQNGRTLTSGAGYLQFAIEAGGIVNQTFTVWVPFIGDQTFRVVIPEEKLWLGQVNAEFGTFAKSGGEASGFKAFVDVPVLGSVGAFFESSGGIDFLNVSQYQLHKPFDTSASYRLLSYRAQADSVGPRMNSNRTGNSKVIAWDRIPERGPREEWYFDVPDGKGGSTESASADGFSMRLATEEVDVDNYEELERLVFVVSHTEGDPVVTAVSPSGERYAEGMRGVEVLRSENSILIGFATSEVGRWKVEVDNLTDDQFYEIIPMGIGKVFTVDVETPSYVGQLVTDSLDVTGSSDAKLAGRSIKLFASDRKSSYTGTEIGEALIGEDGRFTIPAQINKVVDGEYYIYVSIDMGESPSVRNYAPGSIVISHEDEPLGPVDSFVATENGDGDLEVIFSHPAADLVKGYTLYIENSAEGGEQKLFLGDITRTTLAGFNPGDELSLRVAAMDFDGIEGAHSEPVTVLFGSVKDTRNAISLPSESASLTMKIDTLYEGSFTLSADNPVVTDSAQDLAVLEITGGSDNVVLSFSDEVVDISHGDKVVNYRIFAGENAEQGAYDFEVTIYNMGNNELNATYNLSVDLDYPLVAVTELSRTEWHMDDSAELGIKGDNFLPGTQVYLDSQELTISSLKKDAIEVTITPQLAGGTKNIRVIGPGGDEAVQAVTILEPSYTIHGYKTLTVADQGSEAVFNFGITGENRFNSLVGFTLKQVPTGWSSIIEPSVLSGGDTGRVIVSIPADAFVGAYTLLLEDEAGNELSLDVQVVEGYPDPRISSISKYSALVGDEVTVFGYGFGNETAAEGIYIGEDFQTVLEWSEDSVTFAVSEGAFTGNVTVVRDGITSNGRKLVVKSNGFNIYPSETEVRLQPGEEKEVLVNIAGYAEWVDLTIENQADLVTAYIDKDGVKPNGSVMLTLGVGEGLENGSYPVVIKGRSGSLEMTKEVRVVNGEAFEIATGELPGGMEGVSYRARIEAKHGGGRVNFSIAEGGFPAGILLSDDGEVYGKPAVPGSYRVTVQASDEEGRVVSKKFTIIIEENSWSLADKDGGQSRYNPVPSPADDTVKWESKPAEGASELLSGDGKVFVIGDNDILGLEKGTGITAFQIRSGAIKGAYGAKTLMVLDADGVFKAYDTATGYLRYSRGGVTNFATNGGILYLSFDTTIKAIAITDGSLQGVGYGELPAEGTFWHENVLYKYDGGTLAAFDEQGWQDIYSDESAHIVSAGSDGEVIYLLNNGGYLAALDENYTVSRGEYTGILAGDMVLGEERIALLDQGELVILEKETFLEMGRDGAESGEIAGAKEKYFIAGSTRLEARNGYDGSIIWSVDRAHEDVLIAGQELFALDGEGVVTCYNGRDNMLPPSTEINVTPALPDGETGYYTSTPLVRLYADDPETYVTETWYWYGDRNATLYDGAFELPEGSYSLAAYSVDSKEFRNPDVIRSFLVDITDPVTTLDENKTDGENNFTVGEVVLNLASSDNFSGVDRIYYTLNGLTKEYVFPVDLDAEGNYTFTYWAKDKAGNYESSRRTTYSVDLFDPEVRAVTNIEDELGIVYMSAEDSFSGVDYIEYRINGSDSLMYRDPVALPIGSIYDVTYRAKDKAGRFSEWQSIVLDLSSETPAAKIEDLKFAYWSRHRYVNENVQVGDPLYAPRRNIHNRIDGLPEYLVGANMIVGRYDDKWAWDQPFITFKAGMEIDVYVMKHKNSGADFSSWKLVEKDFPVESSMFFKGGADIYRRTFRKGDTVQIPGSRMWRHGGANLVFVTKNIAEDLKIFSPNSSLELRPLQDVWFAATPLPGEKSREWFMRIGGVEGYEEWQSLGKVFSGEFTLPYVEEYADLELRVAVELEDGNETITVDKVKIYPVINKASFTVLSPGDGSQIKTDYSVPFEFEVRDIYGNIIEDFGTKSTISGVTSTEIEWNIQGADMANGVIIARQVGPIVVSGSAVVHRENGVVYTKDVNITLEGVDQWLVENFVFDIDLTEAYSEHEDGRWYGFTRDHSDRLGEYVTVDIPPGQWWSRNRTEGMYIALASGESFDYAAPNARYRVKMEVGPIERRSTPYIEIEGKRFTFGRSHSEYLYEIETEVTVEDGLFEILGSDNIGLISLEIQRLDEDDPVIEDSVTKLDRRVVVINQKWWKWNPDHFKKKTGPAGDRDDDRDDDDDDSRGRGRGGRR